MLEPDNTALDGASTASEKAPRSAKRWLEEIKQAECDGQDWYQRARKIERLYLEQRTEVKKYQSQYALLWANVSVLQPAVYARQPQPVVTRRFTDKDPVARNVSEVMERSLITLFDHADIDNCLRSVRDDFLVVGQGTAWVRYVPTFRTETYEYGEETTEETVLAEETLAFDFVNWKDFLHPKARRWEELPWVGRRVFLDDEAGEGRFGKKKWDEAKRVQTQPRDDTGRFIVKDRVCVYEIWSKRDKEVVWVAKDYDGEVLDRRPPLYDLRSFFPCPKPTYATLPTDSLYSIPDYVYYQDQAEEINALTAKIGTLQDALKLVGFYPAGGENGISDAIEKALSAGTSNQMIPVPAWAAWTQGGGSKGMIEWLPLEVVLTTLRGCVELRQALINDVFQITGLSDILRGESDPRETKGAQQIKAQWGGIRIRDRQAEMARFARDLTRIAAEIIAEKFQPETLWQLSGLKFPTGQEKQMAAQLVQQMQAAMKQQAMRAQAAQQQGGQPVPPPQMPPMPPQLKDALEKPAQEELVGLMRDDRLRSYRIDIETDSTIVADEQAEKEARTEYVTVVAKMFQQFGPIAAQIPEATPVIGESLLFLTRAYRAGRQLEDTIEQFVENVIEKAKQAQNQPPAPDPRMEKIKVDKGLGEAKLQLHAQEGAEKRQQDAQEFAAEFALDKAELAAKLQMEREETEAENARTALHAANHLMRPI